MYVPHLFFVEFPFLMYHVLVPGKNEYLYNGLEFLDVQHLCAFAEFPLRQS